MGFVVAPLATALGASEATAGALSTGFGLVGSAVSAFGAIQQGRAQAQMAEYEAQVARNNATIAGQNANYATAAGEARAYDQGLRERAQLATTTAGLAASGIDVNTGSAADVRTSQRGLAQTDVERTRQAAALQAYGYRTQQTNFQAQAQLDTAQAGYAREAGWVRGLGGLITGFTKFGGGFGSAGNGDGTLNFGSPGPGTGGLY